MADDAFKAAEKRGYAKGYVAGRRRQHKDRQARNLGAREDAFWRQAFVAALPACINANGWMAGDKPINNLNERTKLAHDFANEALRLARLQGRFR